MPAYTLTPDDILFFRDGRPMETSGGHGARWPEPSVIFDALHAALHRAFPAVGQKDFQSWEHPHHYGRNGHYPERGDDSKRRQRFGSLATVGPFPVKDGLWLFRVPADATSSKDPTTWLLRPIANDPSDPSNPSAQSNLPPPLKYPLANCSPPTTDEPDPWWTKAAIESYLRDQKPSEERRWAFTDDDLFSREWHTGIAIDPATQTTGRGEAAGKIYAAQYLRLRDGISLGIHATMPMKNGQPGHVTERITELFPAHRIVIVGGQQRPCHVEPLEQDSQPIALESLLPVSAPISGTRVKWLLLSPAVFPAIADNKEKGISAHPGGWLPNWICLKTGQVLLKQGNTDRQTGERRETWRQRVRSMPTIAARLVAARIPKPIVVTGWTEALHLKDTLSHREHGPRPTLLAVPAGAVYYFEAETPEAAAQLAAALNWHSAEATPTTIRNRRSTLLGEKGFGLGVCGTWQLDEAPN
ncbi:MAG: type III-B CRISPR module-associated Cmr3 family protein [Gemmataceae bacterium]